VLLYTPLSSHHLLNVPVQFANKAGIRKKILSALEPYSPNTYLCNKRAKVNKFLKNAATFCAV
jgi:hypothetical protein